jgi:hypothetical protein
MAVESGLIYLPTRGLDLLEAEEASVEVAVSVIAAVAEVSVVDVDLVIVGVAEASVEVVASVIAVVAEVSVIVEDVEAGVALTVQLLTKIKAISSLSRAKRPLSECAEPAC